MKQWKRVLAVSFAIALAAGNVSYIPAEELAVSEETTDTVFDESFFSDTEAAEETVVSPESEITEDSGNSEESLPADVMEEEQETPEEPETAEVQDASAQEEAEVFFSDGEQAAIEVETEENPMPEAELTSGVWTYNVEGAKATITRYNGYDVTVSIPDKIDTYTVTAIYPGAFAKNTKIETVFIPATVTKIGNSAGSTGAFEGCTNLKYVLLSEGSDAAYIGTNSFYNCSSLQEITIPKNYNKICYRAFSGCTNLKNITITNNNSSIPTVEVGDRAFENCKSLENIYFPPSVKSIGIYAFLDCTALSRLTFSDGLETIDRGAFAGCIKLTTVSIPSTVTKIGDTQSYTGAFENCKALQTVNLHQGESDAYIGDNSFKGCSSLKKISIPANYTEIHYMAFANCSSLAEVTIAESGAAYSNQFIENNAFDNCTALKTVSIPGTVKSIGYWAFRGCVELSALTLGDGIETIDRGAFVGCKKLTSVTIPGSVSVLGSENNSDGVFQNCSALSEVTIKKGTDPAFIGDNTFKDCTSLKKIVIPGNYLRIHYQAFRGCKSLTSMVYENSGASYSNQGIDSYAFAECSNLASVNIAGTVEYIYEFAFMKNTALKSLKLNAGITNIRYGVFAGCTSLETVTIPGTVTTIGSTGTYTGAFQDCTSLYKVEILANTDGKGGFILGQNTFKNCSALNYVYIPASYTNLYISAFTGTAEKLTIWGVEGSKANEFADANSIPFNQVNVAVPKISKLKNVAFGVQITWKAAEQAKSYMVYRRVKGEKTYKYIGKTSRLAYTDTKVTSGITYEYTLVGVNGSNRSEYLKENGSLQYLAMPVGIKVSNKAGYVEVSWNNVSGAQKYSVYRKTPDTKWTRISILNAAVSGDSAAKTTVSDKKVEEGTDYIYTVKAYAGKVASAYDEDGVTTRYLGTGKITSLTNTKTGVTIKWQETEGAGGYLIYRKAGKGKFVRIAKLSGEDTNSYCDETAVNGKGYTYAVRPFYGSSNGTYEEAKTVRLSVSSIVSAKNNKAGTIQVTWKKNSKVTGYQVKYTASGKSKAVYENGTSVELKNLKKGTTCRVYVRGYRTVLGKKYFGPWSSGKTVKITK